MFFDVVVQDVIKESDAVVKSLLKILPLYRCIFSKAFLTNIERFTFPRQQFP